jgi:hypothetical protein
MVMFRAGHVEKESWLREENIGKAVVRWQSSAGISVEDVGVRMKGIIPSGLG